MISFRTIASGSSGNCVLFSKDNKILIIDCGISGRNVTAFLNAENIDFNHICSILVTHEHTDHTKGVGVLARKFKVPVVASRGTWQGMSFIGNVENQVVFDDYSDIDFDGIVVKPFPIPHDANQPTGYLIFADGKKYAVATDIGHLTREIVDLLTGCEAVILEANYDKEMLTNGIYPPYLKARIGGSNGHLDNLDTAKIAAYLAKNGTKSILLGHLSNENNTPEIAFNQVAKEMELQGIKVGVDIRLLVAPRYKPSENIIVDG